jgi:phospholipid/cholesterol/gamma-HCH transport system permease protein
VARPSGPFHAIIPDLQARLPKLKVEREPMPTAARTVIGDQLVALGDWSAFAGRAFRGVFSRHIRMRTVLPIFTEIGANSVWVIIITGAFIGMVLGVHMYAQFHPFGVDAALGTITMGSILNELGPVLAAVMLAGRVGSAMAAEPGTMRVTEQIDALACLGVDPVHYLVSPRFLACVLLIPLLTVIADAAGIAGSTFISVVVYGVDAHHFWEHTLANLGLWDLLTGLLKSVVFGGVLALICCHRGFNCRPGAEGVGRAATEAFVVSFIAILILDFFMVLLLNTLRLFVWPKPGQVGF